MVSISGRKGLLYSYSEASREKGQVSKQRISGWVGVVDFRVLLGYSLQLSSLLLTWS